MWLKCFIDRSTCLVTPLKAPLILSTFACSTCLKIVFFNIANQPLTNHYDIYLIHVYDLLPSHYIVLYLTLKKTAFQSLTPIFMNHLNNIYV